MTEKEMLSLHNIIKSYEEKISKLESKIKLLEEDNKKLQRYSNRGYRINRFSGMPEYSVFADERCKLPGLTRRNKRA
jgi:hypothetical protein